MEVQSAFAGAASAAAAALGMGDAFHIDDLLDFSNEDIAGPIGESFHLSSLDSTVTTAAAGEAVSGDSAGVSLTGNKHPLDAGPDDHSADVLCVPCDDLAELEWLSKFVEDSFSMGGTPTRACNDLSVSCEDMQFESSYNSCKDRFQSASPVSVLESSASSGSTRAGSCTDNNAQTNHQHHNSNLLYRDLSVPGRARSKRARTGGRVWGNSRILAASSASTTDTESLSSDSNVISEGGGANQQQQLSSSALSADNSSHQQQHQQHQQSILLMMTPPPKAVTTVKKPWKPNSKSGSSSSTGGKKGGLHDGGAGAATQPWRCLHCATQRTPQWRAGPMGPKTLCNACGVRYKSGRLLPEYRPAGSPGYVGHKHSNSHKKILEMRRQKEQHHNHHLSQSPPSPSSLLEDDSAGVCSSQN
ncbi:unnamed protein product [Calypogeia fissa]